MVHQFKNNGYDIVLDVNSGAIHVVDDVTYDVIALFEDHSREEIIAQLQSRYPEQEIAEAIEETEQLKEQGDLFTEDAYEQKIFDFKKRPTVVKALCLHIAHDCNLACRYCFAEEGEYHGRRALMSYETGKQALDFLIANSGNRKNLEVDFFGGEPLMNFDVVKQLVAYGREQEKLHDKHFRFTLTTNGVLLNDDIMEFANKEMDNVVLSIDGRKEVNDRMRPFRKGAGSYDLIVPKLTPIFPRMYCIWPIWDSSRFLWSRLSHSRPMNMHCRKRIFRFSLKNMINWQRRWSAVTEKEILSTSSIS